MQMRKLGYSDLELTTVGLGTWAMGGPWQFGWGPQDDGEAIAAIVAALQQGINWIDTAPAYSFGHSEELVGKALKQTGIKPLIATKCGILWDDNGQITRCLKAQSVRDECYASLKRLGIEAIDLYQIHWPLPDEDLEEAWEEMAKLAEEGKVRYLGTSNFSVDQIKRVQKIHPVASLQPPYSMLHREAEEQLLDYCAQENIGVIVYSPMQRGLLTGKFNRQRLENLPEGDHRKTNPDFAEPKFSATMELVDQLRPIAERNSITLAQLAISWVLHRKEITAAIVGARRPEQIIETSKASDFELSKEENEEIEKLLGIFQEKINNS